MDLWGREFLSAVDSVLMPELTAAIQIVDKRKGKNYLQQILEQKKTLADIIKKWIVPVFRDENPDPSYVREVFYQQLLSRLSNAYTTRAAVQFNADVKAAIKEPPAMRPPRLSGRIIQKEITDSSYFQQEAGKPGIDISLTSPKLTLKTGTGLPVPFLLTAPEIIRNDNGAVLPNIILNLTYDGVHIEHQIGQVPGIRDYEASSWLSFVTRETCNPLSADLGEFKVPLVLRSYPASPFMSDQSGNSTYPGAKELDRLTRWDYAFTYTLPFHYPQDTVVCRVDFNLPKAGQTIEEIDDAFAQLAQFITVFPQVKKDLATILAGIDAATTDQKQIDDAAVALESFITLTRDVTDGSGKTGLIMPGRFTTFSEDNTLAYQFSIRETSARIDGVDALVVIINGSPPAGIGPPQVLLQPENSTDQYTIQRFSGSCMGDYCYWYKKKNSSTPLSSAAGQKIKSRTVVLPDMDILQRQSVRGTVFLLRNEDLVPDKKIATPFIYTSPDVRFPDPFLPTIDLMKIIDISRINSNKNSTRSLKDHLRVFFAALLKNNVESEIIFQGVATYNYSINENLDAMTIPILMQAPLSVNVNEEEKGMKTLSQMITDWNDSISLWFTTHTPSGTGGILSFDVTIMSTLTEQPMPLLRLRRMILPVCFIQPPLSTR